MAYISDKYKFFFFRFPRVASLTLSRQFSKLDRGGGRIVSRRDRGTAHIMPRQALEYYPDTNDYFKIVFVRNPWDMCVSLYHHFRRDWKLSGFGEFIEKFHDDRVPGIYKYTDYVFNEDGSLQVDFVGRYETLQESFDDACELIGLPSREIEEHKHKSDREEYTAECYFSEPWMIEAVRNYYGVKWVEKLGYEYGK
jgi:hypothetical protein